LDYLIKYLCCIFLLVFSCKYQENNNGSIERKITFVNNAGYIKLALDSSLNDSYFYTSGHCTGYSWEHVIKNEKLPKVQRHFISSGYSDSIYYLYISYPSSRHDFISIERLDSILQQQYLKEGPNRIAKSFIKKIGKHEWVLKEFNSYQIMSSKVPNFFSAENTINITIESNLHSYNDLQEIFYKILASIDYKIDVNKLGFRLAKIDFDSLINTTNQMNEFQ
jgi:hypothetical protein